MHWHDLIPTQFHVVSGLRGHVFRTIFPQSVRGDSSTRITIDRGNESKSFVVSANTDPRVFETLRLLDSVDGETNRELRYLTVHNAHEVLLGPPSLEARSIRHSFAHASTELRDPAVVASLKSRFGSTRVDFRLHVHKREIFRCLGSMLIALDAGLSSQLLERYD